MSELQQRSRSIRRRVVVVLHTLMLLLMGLPAAAGTGDVDPTYGEGGTSPAFAPGFTAESALQPDGKLVMVGHYGTCLPSYSCSLVVARLTADGLPDPSFGSNGQAVLRGNAMGTSVDIQDDGKIVVGGAAPLGQEGLLVRLETNGTVDGTFGLRGYVEDPAAPIMDVEVLEDGKILAQRLYLGLSRHNSDGTPDISFGYAGFTHPGLPEAWARGPDHPWGSGAYLAGSCLSMCGSGALQVLEDGSIVIAEGRSSDALDRVVMTIARFERDGSVDNDFGTSGTAEASFEGNAFAYDLDHLDDGTLLVAGPVARSGGYDVGMALFTPTGELDPSFGDGGTVQTDRLPWEQIMTATPLRDRSILVGGFAKSRTMSGPLLIRYGRDGIPTAEFGDGGFMTIPAPIDTIHDVFPLDEQLLLVGSRFRATRVEWPTDPPEPECSIVGTEEHDVLRGTPADDVICGLGGNDVLIGNGGADLLVGGAGDDHLHTRDLVADDVSQGGEGHDYCNADEEDLIDSCP